MATELAKAYVQIVPSAEGIKGSISSAIGPEADEAGRSAGEKVSGGIISGISSIAKVGAAAIGSAAAAIGAALGQSVSGFAEQEQLIGGVQKLYGNMGQSLEEYAVAAGKSVEEVSGEWQNLETAQNTVLENARNAYKTAGMDMNTYMDTATSFSASLISSLNGDTVKAAEQTDVAMRAISDNFNTFGGDISNIQNAYQGFAKQNYTMLDNLKLGYGGTKSEMERLIQDAEKVDDSFKAQRDSSGNLVMGFADIVTAIQKIQEQQGIAGTTAREASTTIAGSFGMLKAAWSNLVTGFSDKEADLDSLMKNVVDSVVGYTDESGQKVKGLLDNVMPVIETALSGIGQIIEKAAPIIAEKLPGLVSKILPGILSAATSLVGALISALPGLAKTLIAALPGVWEQIKSALSGLAGDGLNLITEGFTNGIPNAINSIQKTLSQSLGNLLEFTSKALDGKGGMLGSLADGIIKGLPKIYESITNAIGNIIEVIAGHAPGFIESGAKFALQIGRGILGAIPDLLSMLNELTQKIFATLGENLPGITETIGESFGDILAFLGEVITEHLPGILEKGGEILRSLIEGISLILPELATTVGEMISTFAQFILESLPDIISLGAELVTNLITGFGEMLPQVIEFVGGLVSNILEGFRGVDWLGLGIEVLDSIVSGLASIGGNLIETLVNLASDAMEKVKEIDWVELGKNIVDFIAEGIQFLVDNIPDALKHIGETAAEAVKDIDWADVGKKVIGLICDGLHLLFVDIPNLLKSIGDEAVQKMKDIDWADIGANIINGIIDGIKSIGSTLVDAGVDAVQGAWQGIKDWLGIASPSKRAKEELGKNWALGIAEGFKDNMPEAEMTASVKTTMAGMRGTIASVPAFAQGTTESDYDDIIAAISELKQAILSMRMVMDSGETVAIVDQGLGREAMRAAWQ